MNTSKSENLFRDAQEFIPGGVNSPVRAFKSVGGTPRFIVKGEGSRIWDEDGNEYIDYVGSWGPHLFGHNPLFIKEALEEALAYGTSFGAPTKSEITMAELLCELVPSLELVRMVNSGTEATMSAIRLARGYTGRDKIIKFEGCYHGHGDSFLIKAGSGALTFGVPTSPGVTKGTATDTLNARYNDIDSVNELLEINKDEVAAIIIEPVGGNMGVIPAKRKFLEDLRKVCDDNGIVLIFDEVMTGFRLARGGAQELYNIKPDLSTLGKVIGGGLPVGAFGGKKEIMSHIAPLGPVYQAGTLSGNPLAMAAGIAMLSQIRNDKELYTRLEEKGDYLESKMLRSLNQSGLSFTINRVGSMLCLFFTNVEVIDFETAFISDTDKYGVYFHTMLERGVYLAPSQFEAVFVSDAHSHEDLDKTAEAFNKAIESILS